MNQEMLRPELEPNYSHPIYKEFEDMVAKAPLIGYAVYAVIAAVVGAYLWSHPEVREKIGQSLESVGLMYSPPDTSSQDSLEKIIK